MVMPEGPVEQVVNAAVAAERLGCSRVWIPDEGLAARECWVTLGAVAAATSSVEVGTGITNAYTRHPGMTAAAVATLDEASGGRAALGIGAGGALTLTALAIERRAPITAMRELVTTSRALWSGETVDHSGVAGGFRRARLGYGPARHSRLAGRAGSEGDALGGRAGRRLHPVVRPQGADRRAHRGDPDGCRRARPSPPEAVLHDHPGHDGSGPRGSPGGPDVPSRGFPRPRQGPDRPGRADRGPPSAGASPRAGPGLRPGSCSTTGSMPS